MRIPGDNSDGFRNEIDIEKCLDFKLFEEVNPNLQHFLMDVFKGYSLCKKRIHAIRCRLNVKPDFYLSIDGIPKGVYVSVKKGSGNSVHQESLESFVDFLQEIGASNDVVTALKLFHYGDGTTDNTGSTRMSADEFARQRPDVVNLLNDFFSKKDVKEKCLERCVFEGKIEDAPTAQYLYHGTAYSGVWASRAEIFDFLANNIIKKSPAIVKIGPLSYQVWNRNLSFSPSTEIRRQEMQIKWSSLNNILTAITSVRKAKKQRGTEEGDIDEITSVVFFNRDPLNSVFSQYLSALHMEPEKTLLVRVSTRQYSKLSGQKVMTRADAYAIEVKDDRIYDVLEENEFYLDETILTEYSSYYTFIPFSGISIKLHGSTNYQLLKLTPKSFESMFGSFALGAGASLFCQNLEELPKNLDLLRGWNTNSEHLQAEFSNLEITEQNIVSSLDLCKRIKKIATDKIHSSIDQDSRLQKMIFNGLYIYDEPYVAYYFMQDKVIKALQYINFAVTTGSGRSRGEYTLVFKPR